MNPHWMLQPDEFDSLQVEGSSVIGTLRDPQTRERYHDFGRRMRGFDSAYVCWGSVTMLVGDGLRHDPRPELLPVCRKQATLYTSGHEIKARISEDASWQFNPVLKAQLEALGIAVPPNVAANPRQAARWLKTQLQYGGSDVASEAFIGLSNAEESNPSGAEQELAGPDLALAS